MASQQDDQTDATSRAASLADVRGGRPAESNGGVLFRRFADWLTSFGEQTGNALVYSSAYLSGVAMVEVAIAMVLLAIPANPAPIVVGLVTFAVYANDRIVDASADEVTVPEKAAFVRRHRGPLYVLSALAYGIAVAIAVLGGPFAIGLTLVPGLFWVLYASDWLPRFGATRRRLKEILVLNSGVVALAWAATVTLLPLAFTDRPVGPAAGLVFGYFLLRSFVDTEIPNVRDIEADAAAGIATLPVAYGVVSTRRILYGVDVVTGVLIGYGLLVGHLGTGQAVALLTGLVYSLAVVSRLGRFGDVMTLTVASELEYVVVGLALSPLIYGL